MSLSPKADFPTRQAPVCASALRIVVALFCTAGGALAQTYPPPLNLTRYMPVAASSGSSTAKYAVDGMVCEESRWKSANVTTPHWLQVTMPGTFEIGSANVITGDWDVGVSSFKLQYWSESAWTDIPGATVTGNASSQRQIVFTSPVTTNQVRFYSDQDWEIEVKELAVFPPKSGGGGYPINTTIDIRSGQMPMITASSQQDANFRPYLAYDGFVADNSRWLSANVTTQHWLEYAFVNEREVAYAHVYTGLGNGSAIANYTLQYWNAASSAWENIPGGAVTGNSATQNLLTFTSTIRTTNVRLVSDDDGTIRVKEMVFFPPNGGVGYPAGTSVVSGSPPTQRWGNSAGNNTSGNPPFSDNFYQIKNRVAGLNLRTAPNGTVTIENSGNAFSQQYHILLNVGTDSYRICNRANERCLEVADGSLSAGGVVREGDYNALPYQQWRLVATGSYYKLVNVYSGLLLTVNGTGSIAGTGLIQSTDSGSTTQHWSFSYVTHFPKKGSSRSEVSGDFVERYNASHWYGWGLYPGVGGVSSSNDPTHFIPMWWNNRQDRTADLLLRRAEWAVSDVPKYLMGFNEPNHSDQANMSVQTALDEWSRAEQVNLPLVGPQHDYAWGSWYTSFFDQADAKGFRIDEGGGHIYPTASSVNYDSFNNGVSDGYYAQNNRLQWVTEWNWVNWGGAATWTSAELYSVVAETLWRYENNGWVKRHEFFAFSPYWQNGAPGALQKDGNILPLGRLYSGWDGDLTVRANTWYHLHNRAFNSQLWNSGSVPGLTPITTVDSTINWHLMPAGSGKYHIVSSDGMRLSSNGTTVTLAAVGTTGTALEWALSPIQYGWYYIEHPASGKRLDSASGSGLSMSTDTDNSPRWRFIKPYVASTPAPGLLAQYRFQGNTMDDSGSANHATATGSPAYADGRIGQAISLDGVDDVVTAAIGLTDKSDITVATWVKWNGGGDWQRIFDFGPDTDNYMFLTPKAGGGGLRFAIKNGSAEQQLNAPVLATGQWVHVAVTLNGDTGTLYVNGAAVDTKTIIINPNDFKGSNHYIGKSQFAADPLFSGAIDDFRVYNYAVSAGVIADLAAGDTIAPAAPTGLVGGAGNGVAYLDWADNVEPDLASYTVYRSTTSGGGYSPIATGLTTSDYTDNSVVNGGIYYYVVTAKDFAANESPTSAEVHATPSNAPDIAVAAILPGVSVPGATGLTLATSAAFNMTGGNAVALLVTVERSASTDSISAQFAGQPMTLGVSTSQGVQWSGIFHLIGPATTNGQFVINRSGSTGATDLAYSAISLANVGGIADFAAVANTTTSTSGTISLTTKTTLDGGFVLGAAANNAFDAANPAPSFVSGDADMFLRSATIIGTSGHLHTYGDVPQAGRRTNVYGNLVQRNAYVTLAFDKATALDTTPPAAPTGLVATPGDSMVGLDWADNTEPDLESYTVYRSTTSGSGYAVIASGLTASGYTDDTSVNGTTYYYIVTATDNLSNESASSSEVSATPMVDSTTYAGWAVGQPFAPGEGGPGFDVESDGLANAFEWLLGGDPFTSDSGLLPVAKLRSVNGTEFPGADPTKRYLSITATIRKNITDITLVAQAAASPDLLDAPGSSDSIISLQLQDLGDFEIREWICRASIEDAPVRFMRLKLVEE